MLINNINIKIRNRRLELGFKSAEQFAYDNKISRSTYERIERGEDMRLSTFLKVAECLKLNPKDLL